MNNSNRNILEKPSNVLEKINPMVYNTPENGGDTVTTKDFIDIVKRYQDSSREKIGQEYLGVCKQSLSTTIRRNALKLRDMSKILDGAGLEMVIVPKLPDERKIVCVENVIQELERMRSAENIEEKDKQSIRDCIGILGNLQTEEIK